MRGGGARLGKVELGEMCMMSVRTLDEIECAMVLVHFYLFLHF